MTVSTTKNLQSYTTKSIGLQIRRIMLHARDFLFQHGILKSAMSCPGCSSIMNLVSCSSKKSSDLLIWRFSACSRFRNTWTDSVLSGQKLTKSGALLQKLKLVDPSHYHHLAGQFMGTKLCDQCKDSLFEDSNFMRKAKEMRKSSNLLPLSMKIVC